jgi:hypothetical protein
MTHLSVFLQITRDIPENIFPQSKFIEKALHPGPPTRLLTFEDAVTFMMVLPGTIAREVRVQFGVIIRRHMGGDKTLHDEINANAVSNSTMAQLARASIGEEPVVHESSVMVGLKRRREELELLKLEHEINTLIVENKVKEENRVQSLYEKLEHIQDPKNTAVDGRTRLMFQDTYLNLLLNTLVDPSSQVKGQAGAAIMNGPSPNKPISIGSVATELGYNPTSSDSKKIGMDLSKRYIQLHGERPTKHDQLCDGRVTSVNSYTEQDRPMVTEALHAYFKPSSA